MRGGGGEGGGGRKYEFAFLCSGEGSNKGHVQEHCWPQGGEVHVASHGEIIIKVHFHT